MAKSYIVIRREDGAPDLLTYFPENASVAAMVRWCERDGYKVLGHETIPLPEDAKHLAKVIITVKRGLG